MKFFSLNEHLYLIFLLPPITDIFGSHQRKFRVASLCWVTWNKSKVFEVFFKGFNERAKKWIFQRWHYSFHQNLFSKTTKLCLIHQIPSDLQYVKNFQLVDPQGSVAEKHQLFKYYLSILLSINVQIAGTFSRPTSPVDDCFARFRPKILWWVCNCRSLRFAVAGILAYSAEFYPQVSSFRMMFVRVARVN